MANFNTNVNKEQFKEMYDFAKSNKDPGFTSSFGEAMVRGDFNKFGSLKPVKQESGIAKVGKALISSEIGFGEDIAGALTNILPKSWTGLDKLDEANKTHVATMTTLAKMIETNKEAGKDVTKLQGLLQDEIKNAPPGVEELYPALKKTDWQVAGDAAGTLLDILSVGSYSKAKMAAKSGQLATKVVEPVIADVAKKTVKDIAIKTAKRTAVGAGTGYAYDVAENMKSGKEGADIAKPGMGTILGGSIPFAIGVVQGVTALTKATAPKFINSLVKPKVADFSYGKDPGRTVSELGIVGNNLDDFADNIAKAKDDIGTQIGAVYSNPANANVVINATDDIARIDDAIAEAAKGGKQNQGIVTALQDTKDALLYDYQNVDGVVTKVGDTPRDLSKLNPQEAFDLKQKIANQTKFTGRPSDDKTVNATLKRMYGNIKDKINKGVGVNNPEITDLNQKYADLTSAEIATRNRDAIIKRADMVSLKVGGAGTAAALISGAAALPATLIGIGAASLEKAMETTAVKTRIAKWLGSESPSVIANVIKKNPAIKETLYRLVPKLASQLGE